MVFPWQSEQWQQLMQAQQDQRLPHALLFSGIAGVGKAYFAECFIKTLLCAQLANSTRDCNCHACRLIEGRTHPNVLWITPEKIGQAIKVDQVREVSEFINQTSLQGTHRIVIINPAHAMNISAANALLKTLEEPAEGAILILIADQVAQLPATILSRCQRVQFPRPPKKLVLTWLKEKWADEKVDPELILNLANGAPLAALNLAQDSMLATRQALFDSLCVITETQFDPIKSAVIHKDMELLEFLDLLLVWITDLIRLQLQADASVITNKDYLPQLNTLNQKTQLEKNTSFMDYLQHLRQQIPLGINFNKQLLMEGVFLRWMECVNVSR